MNTLACVVAYNRADLLRRVLAALVAQTEPVDVLVVDNASTDGTAAVVGEFGDRVRYFNTGANLGGAGGFAWAIELAIALGYRSAYLLDDDAIPAPDAIEALTTAAREPVLRGVPYLVSQPVAADGVSTPAGVPEPSLDFAAHFAVAGTGAIALDHAAFLGVLIDLDVARQTALPYPEFFIWCDDVEYTTRLNRVAGRSGVCVPGSRIVHESLAMENASARKPIGWKYRYRVRNSLWLARWGLPDASRATRGTLVSAALRATANELLRGDHRGATLLVGGRAWLAGLAQRRPEPHRPGSLLAGDTGALQRVARTGPQLQSNEVSG